MRISDWSSDVCSSDLAEDPLLGGFDLVDVGRADLDDALVVDVDLRAGFRDDLADDLAAGADDVADLRLVDLDRLDARSVRAQFGAGRGQGDRKSTRLNSQSLMRNSYAVFCLKQ